ncbi:MAG TPA: oligosaccharide flippase family protein [Polyangia bacterium]|jgi:O-antigen/teichoic acid export membrane protein
MSPPQSIRSLLRRASHYAGAGVAAMIAGMISYPLLTRTLDVEDYGAMGLIQVILLAGVAGAKLGLQNSIVRLWPVNDRTPEDRASFASTFFYAALILGGAAALVCVVADVALHRVLPRRLVWPLAIASLIIPARALFSFAQSFMRAREDSRAYALTSVGAALLGLPFIMLFVLWLMAGPARLSGFYLGILIAEAVMTAVALRVAFAGTSINPGRFRWSLAREGLTFGLPLVIFEAASLVLLMGDRVILQLFRTERELGYYTAAFSLVWQLAIFFAKPLELAVVPMFTNAYEHEGAAAASALVSRINRLYALAALPMIAGLWAVREDLIIVLASHKYRAAQNLLPLLLAGALVFGARVYVGAGLFLAKKSRLTALIAAGAAALNVVLNLALVPRFGAGGSAAATGLASLALVVAVGVAGRRHLPFDLGLRQMALYAAGAVGMALAVSRITLASPQAGFGAHLAQLLARAAVGAVLYAAFALVADPEARALVSSLRSRTGVDLATPAAVPQPGRPAASGSSPG